MSYDLLTSSGITSLVSSYTASETSKIITPLTTRQAKYQNLISGYSTLSSKLDALNSTIKKLKATGSDSAFTLSRSTSVSDSSYLTATAKSTTPLGSYSVKVNQLAKTDNAVSSTLTSKSTNSVSSGIHTLRVRSGDYETNVDVEFSASETNLTAMQKITKAINNETSASVRSNYNDKSAAFTMNSSNNSFDININGTTTSISLDESAYSGITNYDNMTDALVTAINKNKTLGAKAEKVYDSSGNNVALKIKSTTSSAYITINSSGLDSSGNRVAGTNSLMNSLGISAFKEKSASSLVSSSVINPSDDTSKLSLSAQTTGYTNRLLISSDDALTQLGLTSDILTNRYKNSDDGTSANETKAGFSSGTKWLDTLNAAQGTAETATSNLLNSKILFNGISVQRDSNTVSDLVSGLSLTLKSTQKSTDSNLDVSVTGSTDSIKSTIQDFITNFNTVYYYLKTNSSTTVYSNSSYDRGIFAGDETSNSLISGLTKASVSTVGGLGDSAINKLQELGISFTSASGLTMSDSTKLDNALSSNLSQVESLFNSTNGIATKLSSQVSNYLGTDGYLAKVSSTYTKNINDIANTITTKQANISKSATVLRNKYNALQTQLTSLLLMQNSLSSLTSDTSTSS